MSKKGYSLDTLEYKYPLVPLTIAVNILPINPLRAKIDPLVLLLTNLIKSAIEAIYPHAYTDSINIKLTSNNKPI